MFTSNCPVRSAQAIDDTRLLKMMSKSHAILTESLYLNGTKVPGTTPKKVKDEFSDWAGSNYKNYMWVLDFFMSIQEEIEFRGFETPKEWEDLFFFVHFRGKVKGYEKLQEFPNSTKYKDNVLVSNRKSLEELWNNDEEIPEWTKRGIPQWSWRHDNNLDKLDTTSYNCLDI